MKQAKLLSHGTRPQVVMPAATPIMFCSAMPISRKRLGRSRETLSALVELAKSPSSTYTRGSRSMSSMSASPKASRWASISPVVERFTARPPARRVRPVLV